MNKLTVTLGAAVIALISFTAQADSNDAECKKLQNDYNIIYAAKGFCFKDKEAQAQFGNQNCHTTKPKFNEKEQKRLDDIKARQKELNCKEK